MKEKLQEAYINYLFRYKKAPHKVSELVKEIGETETTFYQHFDSLTSLESSIWEGFVQKAIEKVEAEEVYATYSAREKLLALEYTLIEVLKPYREFVAYSSRKVSSLEKITFPHLKAFKSGYKNWVRKIVDDGIQSGEFKNRPFITERYVDALWLQLWFVIQFWLKDHSSEYEKTDAAIEKSLNTLCDFLGHTPLDSALDFAKFLFQSATSK